MSVGSCPPTPFSQELYDLFNLDLSKEPRLELVRDQFIVLCWTGLRISDFRAFNDIPKSREIITIHSKKTNQPAHIPIFPQAQAILKKYNGRFPKMISEQKMRDYLKEIGERIPGLNRSIEITYTKAGKVKSEIKKRYELLTIHCARRTMATNLATLGIPYHEIMLITGHKSMRTFEIYIKVNRKNVLSSMIDRVREKEGNMVG